MLLVTIIFLDKIAHNYAKPLAFKSTCKLQLLVHFCFVQVINCYVTFMLFYPFWYIFRYGLIKRRKLLMKTKIKSLLTRTETSAKFFVSF